MVASFSFSFVAGVALVDDIVIVADYLVKVVVALIKLDGTHGGEIRRGDVAVDIALLARLFHCLAAQLRLLPCVVGLCDRELAVECGHILLELCK